MWPLKTQCIKHILQFHIDNGKGVAITLHIAILKYPNQMVQIQCKVVWMLFYEGTEVRTRSDRISSLIHKETESLLQKRNKHRPCACNVVH